MNLIYLDNASTTPLLPEVIDTMTQAMKSIYGNPSSTHQVGRNAKAAIENARRNIAQHFGATASEIIFTSGGSEGNNFILKNAVSHLGVTTIISSKLEHKAVLETLNYLKKHKNIAVKWVRTNKKGQIDIAHLQELLQENDEKKLVSLMYINNEISTRIDLEEITKISKDNGALFHSDTVQGIGHFNIDVQKIPIDFFIGSAHKFHGPKGVGFIFVRKGLKIKGQLLGGPQEKGMRAGTENVISILGMEKALKIAYKNLEEDANYIQKLKSYCIERIKETITDVRFNGEVVPLESSYTILNVQLPTKSKMLLLQLDLNGIAVSGGSACQSGSHIGSHVLTEILNNDQLNNTSIRFSFSKFNTLKEINSVVETIKKLL